MKVKLLLALMSFSVMAEDQGVDLFELSFDELLDIEVSVVGGNSSKSSEVFFTVGKVTQQIWQQYDADYVFDTLKYEPGIEIHRSLGGSKTLSIRGYADSTGSARGKALLFDGIPLNGFAFGTALYSKSFLPSELLQSVEVVRGPISSFYGPDAFHGAIALNSWNTQGLDKTLYASISNLSDTELGGRFGYQWLNTEAQANTNFHIRQKADSDFQPGNSNNSFEREVDSFTIHQQWFWDESKLSVLLSESSASGFSDIFSADSQSGVDTTHTHLISYSTELSGFHGFNIEPTVWYHDSVFDFRFFDQSRREYWNDEQFGSRVLITPTTSDDFQLGTEVVISELKQSLSHAVSEPEQYGRAHGLSKEIFAVFGQYSPQITEQLSATIGTRIDYFTNSESVEISPNIGFIYDINKRHQLKLLAGRGFRAPAAGEIAGTGVFVGNESLKGETLTSKELIYQFNTDRVSVNVSLFDSHWQDAIMAIETSRSIAMGMDGEFSNAGSNKANGFEIDSKYYVQEMDLLISATYSQAKSKNKVTDETYRLYPKRKWSLGAVRQGDVWNLSAYYLNKSGASISSVQMGEELDDHQEITASASYKLDDWTFKLSVMQALSGDNISPSIWGVEGGIYEPSTNAEFSVFYSFE